MYRSKLYVPQEIKEAEAVLNLLLSEKPRVSVDGVSVSGVQAIKIERPIGSWNAQLTLMQGGETSVNVLCTEIEAHTNLGEGGPILQLTTNNEVEYVDVQLDELPEGDYAVSADV